MPSTLAVAPAGAGLAARGRGAGRAMSQVLLDRARHRHRGRAGEAGDQAPAERSGECGDLYAVTSSSITLGASTVAPRRSINPSPTRSALAIAVSAGFTAP